ncbi:DUF881 domain-containing protein [Kitasatospora sp. NPDC101157]|uniref:DUF881 domain-containing protein n=1 Tax=Kitasatospora sp. NPDC101157 TaxID=3364098 RepID=UPI0037F9639F
MSSGPEPGRETAATEEEKTRAEAPVAEESVVEPVVEPVEKAPAEAAPEAQEVSAAVPGEAVAEPEPEPSPEPEPEESDAKAELEGGAGEPEPSVRLVKEPEPEPVEVEAAEVEAAEAEAEAVEPSEAAEEPPAVDRNAGRRRLQAALWPPRLSRGQLVVALLLFSLGLALAIQVRSTNDHHNQLRGARQEDLVRILDELDSRQQRLQQEKAELEQSLGKLENSSNQAKEAQEQTRKKMTELGVLAGTVKATGPGIVLTVDDPQGLVKADMLLDTLQELRAAGAEAIQINDVRVVVNTYFTDLSGGGVQIDGKKVSQPYRFTVVGNPQDLTPALNIPGGVVRTLESHQARATITQQQKVVVDALVDLKSPQYAKPASK